MVCYFILSKEEEFAWLRLRKQMFYIKEWILFFQDKHDIVSKWHKLMFSSFRLPYAVAKLNHHDILDNYTLNTALKNVWIEQRARSCVHVH